MAQTVRTGLFQYIKWGVAGAVPANSMGCIDGGNVSLDPGTRHRYGISGAEIRKGGVITPSGSATFYITETNIDFLATYGLRASYPAGALSSFSIRGGSDEWAWTYNNAMITDFSIDYAQGEGLKSTINWLSKNIYESTAAVGSYPTEANEGFEDYECVISVEGAEYAVQSFSIKVNNNVSIHTSADTKVAGAKRLPERLIYGAEVLTVGITTAKPIAIGTMGTYADCLPADLGAILTATNGCDGDEIVFTLTNLQQVDPSTMSFTDHATAGEWGYGFDGSSQSGSLAIADTAGS